MEAKTIEDIRAILGPVEQGLESFNTAAFKGLNFGEEQEFSAKSLIAGARAVITDVKGQVEKPDRFLRLTTAAERRSIIANLDVLNAALQAEQLPAVAGVLQELKVILRPFQFRGSSETREQLETAVNDLHRQIESIKDERRKIAEENARLLELAAAVTAKLDESGVMLEGIQKADSSMDDLLSSATTKNDEISELNQAAALAATAAETSKVSANASKELVDEFVRKISAREIQLTDQQAQTDAFTEALSGHRTKMGEVEAEAQRVITSARTALSYKTAEGLSAI